MSHIITKAEYFAALDDEKTAAVLGQTNRQTMDLKHLQDAWVLHRLRDAAGLRILEIGGGHSRALRHIADANEIWNLDDFGNDGTQQLNRKIPKTPGVKIVAEKLGVYSRALPDSYFDLVVSISVVEHIPFSVYPDFWRDHARVMKTGGRALHAIDMYVGDSPDPAVEHRLDELAAAWASAGLDVADDLPLERPVVFRSHFASNPDHGMWFWNKISPNLIAKRSVVQSVSLGAVLRKG